MANDERLISITHAAQRLNIAPGTLRQAANRGDIPVVRSTSGARMFRAADVTAYAEVRRKKARGR